MKKLKYLFIIFVFTCLFLPFNTVKAASSYSVEMVSSNSGNRVVGVYGSYAEALNVMNSQNSSTSEVATIYRDGVPVDSKYGIFKLKPGSNYNLYHDSNSSSAYTYISGSSASDTALLGYSENGRVKIMISGFVGWIDINNGVVTPISLLSGKMIGVSGTGIYLRNQPSLGGSSVAKINGDYKFNYSQTAYSDGYTWYRINYNGIDCWIAGGSWVTPYEVDLGTYYSNYSETGNLIHHFTVYDSNAGYMDDFSNLGTAPSFIAPDARYYSFDGNYFYSTLTAMLDDYRNGVYSNSVNHDKPYYPYYLYLTSRSTTGYTADDLNRIITDNGYNESNSKMYGTGEYFKEAEREYGVNALLAFSAAINESKWGTSTIAMDKNNLFGYGAADSCPYSCAYTYASVRDSIMSYARNSSSSYETVTGSYYYGSHYGNKASGKNVKYASDPYWGETMASSAFSKDKRFGRKDFNSSTIGVSKKGVSNVKVYKDADTNSSILYTLKNSYTSDPVYDFPVNIAEKVIIGNKEYYKIYTDLSSDREKHGYVEADKFNVYNSAPIINAEDKEIALGQEFNYMEGISAYDPEDGDLTSRITYSGNVDINEEGTYKVTYTTTDNNNLRVSKIVNITVKNIKPVIANKLTYNGLNQKLVTKKMSGDIYLSLDKELNNSNYLEATTEIPTASLPGEYTVYYYMPASENNEEKQGMVTTTIEKAKVVNPSVKDYRGYYDEQNHTIEVTGGEGGEIEYSLDNQNYSSILPTFSEIGEYKVYVRVNPDENHIAGDVIESKVTILDTSVLYKSHVSGIGWQGYKENGETSGTTGQSRQVEAVQIKLEGQNCSGDILYKTYVSGIGWEGDWKTNDNISGTTGQSKSIEAIGIKLTDEMESKYDIYYRVHSSGFGWLGWTKNGEYSGTVGYGRAMEAIEIKLIKKGEAAPGSTRNSFRDKNNVTDNSYAVYKSHVSGIGWQDYKEDGETSGTTGQSRSIEAVQIKLEDQVYTGNVMYKSHISGLGWEGSWKSNNDISGTTGQSRSIEAIQIKLTDELAEKYDIYYRVHSSGFGWLDWAKNGEYAGTVGYGYAIEAIEIKVVNKEDNAPGSTNNPFVSKINIKYKSHVSGIGWQGYKENGETSGTTGQSRQVEALQIKLEDQSYAGDILYKAHISGIGWEGDWKTNDNISGTTGQSRSIEAIQIKLTDELAEKYDIYYRVHSSNMGWLDWAKNGEYAGTTGFGYAMEAIEIRLVNKGEAAPGSMNNPFNEKTSTIDNSSVVYKSHVSGIGWQGYARNGETSGTTGQSRQLEAIQIKLDGQSYSGNIMYKTHISGIGWEGNWKSNDDISGTTGQSRSIEAIGIKLTDEMESKYDIYYRVHSSNVGWLDWAKNGDYAGTSGFGYAMEAIEIKLVKKGEAAPGSMNNPYISR